ncbi:MAG: hypothetical protein ACXVAX_01720 [Pseudobdellovibrio sp.]
MSEAFAVNTTGRIILGATAITERYSNDDFGSNSNDVLLATTRYYYHVFDVGADKWDYVLDLRDKQDNFGKLNKDQLQLQQKNDFQVRQLSARWLNPDGQYDAQFGRFQVFESGSIYLDGALGEYRFTPEWKAGLLAGLNPKDIEKPYLEFNAKASETGAYVTYQLKQRSLFDNHYATFAYVNQTYNSLTERQFLFNNWVYQWEPESRVINTLYYDFVPDPKVQTLNFLYEQRINEQLSSDVGILHLDVIEYRRNQDLLEKLTASPYDEGRVQFEYKINQDDNLALEVLTGKRQFDSLKKDEITLGYDFNNRFSKSIDIKTQIGYRNNFTSKDQFVKLDLGYYSRDWEITFDNQYGKNKNDDGTIQTPIITDLGLTSYYSKQLYFNLTMERAAEETVTIMSAFFRVGYRFGNQEVPPVRDGAPPRGAL